MIDKLIRDGRTIAVVGICLDTSETGRPNFSEEAY